jgi:hypothetical protein
MVKMKKQKTINLIYHNSPGGNWGDIVAPVLIIKNNLNNKYINE